MTELRIKHEIELPKDVILIKNAFNQNLGDIFLVGGCVRDSLLRIQPKDWDLVTDMNPDWVIEILRSQHFVKNILETGKAFGVVNVITDTNEFEIATMRSDGKYTDSRRPDSVTFGNIIDDSLRRDLTINALYYDLETNEIIDLVGGVDDLKNNVIRTVGKPEDRFNEDKLRKLRCIRFSARFGSELHPDIDKVLKANSSLEGISAERIRDEFIKSIKSTKSTNQLVKMYFKYDLFKWIFGKILVDFFPVIDVKEPAVLIAAMIIRSRFNLDATVKELNRLTYTSEEVSQIAFLLRLIDFKPEKVAKFKKAEKVSKIAPESLRLFNTIVGLDFDIEKFISFELTVSGDDMMVKGVKPGPEMGKAIEQAEFENFKKYF